MKKITEKNRSIIVVHSIRHRNRLVSKKGCLKRQRRKNRKKNKKSNSPLSRFSTSTNNWINHHKKILNINFLKRNVIEIILPEKLNFSTNNKETTLYLTAIRILNRTETSAMQYKLGRVNFNYLEKISTSAALVLTAELCRWDDSIRQNLRPEIEQWKPEVVLQFWQLGFFELFHNNPTKDIDVEMYQDSTINIVKYIKGKCGESKKIQSLKEGLVGLVGENIKKWTFLASGLTEAITNVGHHAYPDSASYRNRDKNWYMSGSYNKDTGELKIVFFDQGIGVPHSLPASKFWEKILSGLSSSPMAEQKRDEVLLKAAVELNRTRTKDVDRGKGLPDFLTFIKQIGNGYISIISQRGFYKYTEQDGKSNIKSIGFRYPLSGTLIIWSTKLV